MHFLEAASRFTSIFIARQLRRAQYWTSTSVCLSWCMACIEYCSFWWRRVTFKVIMVALWNRADHYISSCRLFFFLLSFFFFSSPNLSRRRLDVCHILPFHTWSCANWRCRSETCCTQLAENTGCKKVAKNRRLLQTLYNVWQWMLVFNCNCIKLLVMSNSGMFLFYNYYSG